MRFTIERKLRKNYNQRTGPKGNRTSARWMRGNDVTCRAPLENRFACTDITKLPLDHIGNQLSVLM